MKKLLFAAAIINLCALVGTAQTLADEADNQSWNDFQLTVPMSKYVDFQTRITARFGDNITQVTDERFAIGFVFKPHKSFSITPFYWNITARNSRGQFRTENRLAVRLEYRLPIKKFGLIHRSGFEYRMRRPLNSWRWRPSLTFEKELPKKFIPGSKLFITEEIFYDSLLKRFSRNRFTVGVTKTLTKKLSLDLYYMRQNDGFSRPGDLNVIGTTWKLRL